MDALKKMNACPVRAWSFGQTDVVLMPHKANGQPNVIPATVSSNGSRTLIKISALDVEDPDNVQEVIALLKRREILPPF